MQFTNKLYNILKWVCMIVIPAVQTFLVALGGIWNLTWTDPMCLTLAALQTCMGACLMISTVSYNKAQSDIPSDATLVFGEDGLIKDVLVEPDSLERIRNASEKDSFKFDVR